MVVYYLTNLKGEIKMLRSNLLGTTYYELFLALGFWTMVELINPIIANANYTYEYTGENLLYNSSLSTSNDYMTVDVTTNSLLAKNSSVYLTSNALVSISIGQQTFFSTDPGNHLIYCNLLIGQKGLPYSWNIEMQSYWPLPGYTFLTHSYGTCPNDWTVKNNTLGTNIPIPAAAWLLVSGLTGLLGLKIREIMHPHKLNKNPVWNSIYL